MGRKSFLLIIILSIISCSESPREEYLKNITTEYKYSNLVIIIPTFQEGEIVNIYITNTLLYGFFLNKNYDNYYDFLTGILDHKIKLNTDDFAGASCLSDTSAAQILNEYKEKGFHYILSKYFIEKEKHLQLKPDFNQHLGLVKIMFDNNYYIYRGDYDPRFKFYKIPPAPLIPPPPYDNYDYLDQ